MTTVDDARYSVRQEATGRLQSHWVARFAMEWLGAHATEAGARAIADEHSRRRQAFYRIP
jgi:hypothetical protein